MYGPVNEAIERQIFLEDPEEDDDVSYTIHNFLQVM